MIISLVTIIYLIINFDIAVTITNLNNEMIITASKTTMIKINENNLPSKLTTKINIKTLLSNDYDNITTTTTIISNHMPINSSSVTYTNKFMKIFAEITKLNRLFILLSFIAFILNLLTIIIFKSVFSFKIKYNVYLIFGPITDLICSILFQIIYLLQELTNNTDLVCYLYTYAINPLGYTSYCFSLVISLVISIDR